jgi:hypothetical protein
MIQSGGGIQLRTCLQSAGIPGVFAAAGLIREDQGAEPTQFVAFHFAESMETRACKRVQFRLDRCQKLQPLGGDAGDGLPLIMTAARAPHEAPGLQAINQARNVGRAFHHTLSDLATRLPVGMRPTQDSQYVALRAGDGVSSANLVDQGIDGAGGNRDTEQGFLLGARKARLFQSPTEGLCHDSCYSQK